MNITAVNKYRKPQEEKDMLELNFGHTPDILKKEYLDGYEGIQSEILSISRFDKHSDLSTTYLGKAEKSKTNKSKAEESFPISEQGYTIGKLLDGIECQILLDMGASKSFMSKSSHSTLYLSLHEKHNEFK